MLTFSFFDYLLNVSMEARADGIKTFFLKHRGATLPGNT
jgi:hypothetical protein